MHSFFAQKQCSLPEPTTLEQHSDGNFETQVVHHDEEPQDAAPFSPNELANFSSDEDFDNGCEANNEEEDKDLNKPRIKPILSQSNCLSVFQPLKRQCLEVPICIRAAQKREAKQKESEEALVAIQKLLKSRKSRLIIQ